MVPLSVLGHCRRDLIERLDRSLDWAARRPIARDALVNLRAELPARPPNAGPARLRILCRDLAQVEAALGAAVDGLYCDFQDIRRYGAAVRAARDAGVAVFLATPRIQKPKEGPLFRYLLRPQPDGILVRNLGALAFFARRGVPVVADFSLNAANELAVRFLRERGAARVTASYDLNREQLTDLVEAVPTDWLEVVVHQHMPMFHMEHCVFCAVLSPGTDRNTCGRPCDRHDVQLLDREGMQHPLKADVGCRNTLFNAVPQSAAECVPDLLARGVRSFRIELLNDPPGRVAAVVDQYRQLLLGQATSRQVWTRLRAANRLGVTRGPLET
jgi:putative protease